MPLASPVAAPPVQRAVQPTQARQAMPTASPASPATSAQFAPLPVQRAPQTPPTRSTPNPLLSLISPPRTAEPRVSPVTAKANTPSGSRTDREPTAQESYTAPPTLLGPPPPYTSNDPQQITEAFDPRMLKESQVDELTQRLIGPLTRLLRMELRFDRERVGRLRDNRR
ncbi:hypothetical protein [Streptacidiphilus fuscans]|uniref:Extensin n=1 Tax=Streptacidiphilus fuscans TaxID=2789292 RepID=A0A931B8M9_9ACTN|nr:hypothetical protein [Streptacidiphilus fuscans]MBF9069833.1 hypothetical protein [Streptacidiphilus fuscans]